MSKRLDRSVLASPSTAAVDRCVDIFRRPDGTFGFEVFRRDPEDMGSWTPFAYYSVREFLLRAMTDYVESWEFGRTLEVQAIPMHISSVDPSPQVTKCGGALRRSGSSWASVGR